MDINLRLLGRGGGSSRHNKLSGKKTSVNFKSFSMSGQGISLKGINKVSSQVGSFMSGNAGAIIGGASGLIPIVGSIMLALGGLDRVFSFGTNIYEAHSGESMLSSNMKAYGKTGSSLGLNIVSGFISNRLTEMPRIHRANLALNYNQEIYNMNAYGEKNKVR